MHERHALDLYRTKKDIAIVRLLKRLKSRESIVPATRMSSRDSFQLVLSLDLFRKAYLKKDYRFLSDSRPSHAFYGAETPDTIATLEESR